VTRSRDGGTVDLGNWSLGSTTNDDYFRFFVTGKNTSSTGYQLFLDFIEITRQP